MFQYEIHLYTVVSQGLIYKLQKEKMYYVGDVFRGKGVKSSVDSIALYGAILLRIKVGNK